MRQLAVILGGAMVLAACQSTTPDAPAAPVDMTNPLMAPGYLAQAGSSDQFEIQSGQLAQQASQNPAVRSFANMIIADHTRSTQMLMSAAQSAGLNPPPPALLPPQQAMLDQLRAAGSGAAFDAAFQQIQLDAHQQALALHQNYAANGDQPALKTVAGQIVPVVQMHISHLQSQPFTAAAAEPMPAAPPPPPAKSGERG